MTETRADERRGLAGIGHRPLPREAGELLGAALARGLGHLAVEKRGEELEGRRLPILLTHEQQRDRRRHEQEPGGELHGFERYDGRQTIALGAVADLIVVLHADDEALAGQIRARRTAIAPEVLRVFALE